MAGCVRCVCDKLRAKCDGFKHKHAPPLGTAVFYQWFTQHVADGKRYYLNLTATFLNMNGLSLILKAFPLAVVTFLRITDLVIT